MACRVLRRNVKEAHCLVSTDLTELPIVSILELN